MPQHDVDLLIVGGGLVGATLAAALRDQPLRIAVIEAVPFSAAQQPAYDDRGLGVAPSSQRILQQIGLWSALENDATSIKKIHISDKGRLGATRLYAEQLGVEQLGHVVLGRSLGHVLQSTLRSADNITIYNPAMVTGLMEFADHIRVSIKSDEGEQTISTSLLVVADGGDSACRDFLNIETDRKDYEQTALVTIVTPEKPHDNTAFERFTNTGPLAILPSTEGRCVSVWTSSPVKTTELMELDEATFLKQLAARLGHRLGQFTRMGQRRSYPMRLIKAKQLTGPRFALIGNAAHTIHPNAAQGMNLGLRDVAHLAEGIVDAVRAGKDIGSQTILEHYAQSRSQDHRNVIRFSDGLTRLFYTDNPGLIGVRTAAMLGLEFLPIAKRALARRAMGLSGQSPRLVRGLPL